MNNIKSVFYFSYIRFLPHLWKLCIFYMRNVWPKWCNWYFTLLYRVSSESIISSAYEHTHTRMIGGTCKICRNGLISLNTNLGGGMQNGIQALSVANRHFIWARNQHCFFFCRPRLLFMCWVSAELPSHILFCFCKTNRIYKTHLLFELTEIFLFFHFKLLSSSLEGTHFPLSKCFFSIFFTQPAHILIDYLDFMIGTDEVH